MIIYFFWIVLGVGLLLALGLVTAIASMLGLAIATAIAHAWRCLASAVRGRR